jgi:O-antigen/teichoic acid export membrane protein
VLEPREVTTPDSATQTPGPPPEGQPSASSTVRRLLLSADARSGVLLLACSMIGHVGNYLYYVVAARALTPAQFAEVSAMTGLAAIALMPTTGIQAAVARDIAALTARGEEAQARSLTRMVARRVAMGQIALLVALTSITPAAVAVLDLSTAWVWLVGVLAIVLQVGLQISLGPHQGRERFGLLGFIMAGPMGAFRPLLLVPAVLLAGIVGALGALAVATAVGLLISYPALRAGRPRGGTAAAVKLTGFGPALLVLGAFASLTNADLIIAKVTLTATDAGLYASAALLGKIALYGPSALALVLLPKVTSRLQAHLSVRRPALWTMAATLLTGSLVVTAITVAPDSLTNAVFGDEYASAYALAAPIAIAMTLLSLVHVHIMVSLARGDRTLVRIALAAAALHVIALLLLGNTPLRMVIVTIVVAAGTLAVHELSSPYGFVRLCLGEPRTKNPTPTPL